MMNARNDKVLIWAATKSTYTSLLKLGAFLWKIKDCEVRIMTLDRWEGGEDEDEKRWWN